MYLNEIYKETFYGVKSTFNQDDFGLSNKISSSELLKINIYEIGSITPLSGNYLLDPSMYSSDESNYPENALTIELRKGEYVIAYDEGGFISKTTGNVNDCIKCSNGSKLDFGEFTITDRNALESLSQDNFESVLNSSNYRSSLTNNLIKISNKSKFHIWIEDPNAIGILKLKIYKINAGKYNEKLVHSFIVTKNDLFSFELNRLFKYQFIVSEIKEDRTKIPRFKYPVGTYQMTTYEKVGLFNNEDVRDNLIDIDKNKFRIVNDRLQSLANVNIPDDINPLNHYIMLGKVELMLYIDFNNDEYYIRPGTYAEVFMNLFVPEMEVTEVEKTDDYAIYNIIDFIIVEYDFRDKDRIIQSIKNWIRCNDSDIHIDEYELYYYITNFDLYEWYYSRFKDIIESHFMFVRLSPITAVAYDNVEQLRESQDSLLDFNIEECHWNVITSSNERHYNVIDWNYNDNWHNTGVTNEVKINVTGTAVLKVSKKHFQNVTGVNLENITEGNLSNEQFREFKLNYPIINPYNRLQYWLGIKL